MIHHKICSAILLCNKFTDAACTEYFKVKMMMIMMMMMMMMERARARDRECFFLYGNYVKKKIYQTYTMFSLFHR